MEIASPSGAEGRKEVRGGGGPRGQGLEPPSLSSASGSGGDATLKGCACAYIVLPAAVS